MRTKAGFGLWSVSPAFRNAAVFAFEIYVSDAEGLKWTPELGPGIGEVKV
jgi:hypothetical protein